MEAKTIPLSEYFAKEKKEKSALPTLDKGWDDELSYRALFEQTGEAIFIIGLDFRYITANQQALNLLGYKENELVGKPVNEVVSQGALLNNDIRNIQGAQLQERVLQCKGGPTIPVEISTSIIYDNGKPAYIQSIARDISVKKNTERILKQNALILSTISQATEKLLQSSSIERKIPSMLEALGRIMNISCVTIFALDRTLKPAQMQKKYIWENWKSKKIDITKVFENNTLETLDSHRQVHSVRLKDSATPQNISFISFPIDGAFRTRGYISFFNEQRIMWSQSEVDAIQTAVNLINAVLQRNHYEETIRLNETRNQILVDALPDLIIRIDIKGNILDYSAKPEHPLHIHRDLAYGRKLKETFPEEIVSQFLGEENKNTFASPQKATTFRLPYAKGVYEAQLSPIYAEEAIIIIRDITEQAKLDEMKSDFINRASHELRTPLTAAMLMVELIQEGGSREELRKYWHTLNAELKRQKTLIDRLLSAGRLESGMMEIKSEPLSLLPVLRESMRSVQPIVAKRQISLHLSGRNKTYTALGDKSGLQQVFINLLTNATKFSPNGSEVKIEVSENKTHTNIAIIDNGVGIPEEDIPYLFQRFFRAKNVTLAEIPGSGIGLYIVSSIIKEMGGEITVESRPNEGTIFTVRLKKAKTL